jgi:hypothetical protein
LRTEPLRAVVIGALAAELDGERRDLKFQVVDQLKARVAGAPPRIGNREPVEQLAAGVPEQIRDRARVPQGSSAFAWMRFVSVVGWRTRCSR